MYDNSYNKTLSIVVPAYNVKQYLRQCLDSMAGIDDRVEILIVNDGSTDETEDIAREYEKKYSNIVVISKKNGGHGSALNTGINSANGKYIKCIDSDDWVKTSNLKLLLNFMENSDADIIISGYQQFYELENKVITCCPDSTLNECRYNTENIMDAYNLMPDCFVYHGMAYKRELWLDNSISLSEGVFYEDHEYATIPVAFADSIEVFTKPVYEYRCGTGNQSVSDEKMVKQIENLERVFIRINDFYNKTELKSAVKEYFLHKMKIVINGLFETSLIINRDRKAGQLLAEQYIEYIQQNAPELYTQYVNKYKLLLAFSRCGVKKESYSSLLKLWGRIKGVNRIEKKANAE